MTIDLLTEYLLAPRIRRAAVKISRTKPAFHGMMDSRGLF